MITCHVSPIVSEFAINAIKAMARKRNPKFLPITACPQKYISVAIHGSFPVQILLEDETLNRCYQILGDSLNGVYKAYGKDHHFFQPELIYKPHEKCLMFKIGIYNKKDWKAKNSKK